MRTQSLRNLSLAVGLLASAWGAQADSFNLSLNGTVSLGQYSSFSSGGTQYDQWSLSLSGLDAGNAITVANGDTITATVTLDQALTMPASVNLSSFVFFLFGSQFPAITTGTSGSTSFFYAGVPGPNGSAGTTTAGQLANSLVFFPPNNGAITFDSVNSSFSITDLAQPAMLDGSMISYTLFSPAVPEPSSYALLLAGLALLHTVRRRAR